MAKEYAKKFFPSAAWIRTSKAYAASKFFICEQFGQPAKKYVVHHKRHLTPNNINNPMVALAWDNLQLLCTECHYTIHKAKNSRKVFFDERGQVIGAEDTTSGFLKRPEQDRAPYTRVIRKARARGGCR